VGIREDVVEPRQGGGGEKLIGRQQSRGVVLHEGFRQVGDGLAKDFGGAGSGHVDLVGKPSNCVGVDDLVGAPVDAGVAPVALKVGANIPAVDSGGGPCGALAGLLMHDNVSAKRGNGVSVIIIRAIQAGPCREFGVQSRSS